MSLLIAFDDSTIMVVPITKRDLEKTDGSGGSGKGISLQGKNSFPVKKFSSQPRKVTPVKFPYSNGSPSEAAAIISFADGSIAAVTIDATISDSPVLISDIPKNPYKSSLGAPSEILSVAFAGRDTMIVAYGFTGTTTGSGSSSSRGRNESSRGSSTSSSKRQQGHDVVSVSGWRVGSSFWPKANSASNGHNWFDYTAGKEKNEINRATHLFSHRIARQSTFLGLQGGCQTFSVVLRGVGQSDPSSTRTNAEPEPETDGQIVWTKRSVSTGGLLFSRTLPSGTSPCFAYQLQKTSTAPRGAGGGAGSLALTETLFWAGNTAYGTRYGVKVSESMQIDGEGDGVMGIGVGQGATTISMHAAGGTGTGTGVDKHLLVLPSPRGHGQGSPLADEGGIAPGFLYSVCQASSTAKGAGAGAILQRAMLPTTDASSGDCLAAVLGGMQAPLDKVKSSSSSSSKSDKRGILSQLSSASRKRLQQHVQSGKMSAILASAAAVPDSGDNDKAALRLDCDTFLTLLEESAETGTAILASDWEVINALLRAEAVIISSSSSSSSSFAPGGTDPPQTSGGGNPSLPSQAREAGRLDVLCTIIRHAQSMSERELMQCVSSVVAKCAEKSVAGGGGGTNAGSGEGGKGAKKGRKGAKKSPLTKEPEPEQRQGRLMIPGYSMSPSGQLLYSAGAGAGTGAGASSATSRMCVLAVVASLLQRRWPHSSSLLSNALRNAFTPQGAKLVFSALTFFCLSLSQSLPLSLSTGAGAGPGGGSGGGGGGGGGARTLEEEGDEAVCHVLRSRLSESQIARALSLQQLLLEAYFSAFAMRTGADSMTESGSHPHPADVLRRKRTHVDMSRQYSAEVASALGVASHVTRLRKARREQELLRASQARDRRLVGAGAGAGAGAATAQAQATAQRKGGGGDSAAGTEVLGGLPPPVGLYRHEKVVF
jgi:hypothetical protein